MSAVANFSNLFIDPEFIDNVNSDLPIEWDVDNSWYSQSHPQYTADIQTIDCPFDISKWELIEGQNITCLSATVPRDYEDIEGSGTVDLLVLKISGDTTDPDNPILYFSGGPGITVRLAPVSPLLEGAQATGRDVYTYDYRGLGFSSPIDCGIVEGGLVHPDLDASCVAQIEADTGSVKQYNTVTNVIDAEAIRLGLGATSWTLWGLSYGSQMSLTYLQMYPHALRGALLEGISYQGVAQWADQSYWAFETVIQRILDDCLTDDVCSQTFPNLQQDTQRFHEIVTELDPVKGATLFAYWNTANRSSGKKGVTTLPALLTFFANADQEYFDSLPGSDGLTPDLISLDSNNINTSYQRINQCFGGGARISTDRYDAFNENAPDAYLRLADIGFGTMEEFVAACDAVEARDPLNQDVWIIEPVRSDIPTIVFNGTYDATTPLETALEIYEALRNSQLVLLPRSGHGVHAMEYACGKEVFTAFMADPDNYQMPDCVGDLEKNPEVEFGTEIDLGSGPIQVVPLTAGASAVSRPLVSITSIVLMVLASVL